jgi:hypothetical protein
VYQTAILDSEQNFSPTSTAASTVNPKNDITNELISHRPLESSFKTSLKKMNSIALNLNFQNAKREIGCMVLILQQIKQNHSTLTFLREKSAGATTEEE